MFMMDLVLATFLILNPDVKVHESLEEVIKPALICFGISGQMIDPREIRNVSLEDLRINNKRTENYPYLEELNNFPIKVDIKISMEMNRAHKIYLKKRADEFDAFNYDYLLFLIAETDKIYYILSSLFDARTDYYYVPVKRESLNLLRTLIGEENYYLGKLPSPIP